MVTSTFGLVSLSRSRTCIRRSTIRRLFLILVIRIRFNRCAAVEGRLTPTKASTMPGPAMPITQPIGAAGASAALARVIAEAEVQSLSPAALMAKMR